MDNILSPGLRRLLKSLHIVLAGVVCGGIASILVLLFMMYRIGDNLDQLTAGVAQLWLLRYLVMIPFAFLVATGLVFSLFGGWGYVRYPWLVVKWLGAAVLTAGMVWWLAPAVSGMAALADGFYSIEGVGDLFRTLYRQAVASCGVGLGLMAVLVYVSVHKPWGKKLTGHLIPHRAVIIVTLAAVLTAGVLGVAGNRSLNRYRAMPIRHVEPARLPDGDYRGQAQDGSFTYEVEVTIASRTMTGIRALRNRDGLYARVAEGVFAKAINLQTPAVDAITGASTTSKLLLKAVEDALEQGQASEE